MGRDHIAVLADGHLTAEDEARVDILVSHLRALAQRCAAIYILGDLFEVWLGVARTDRARARVGQALREVRQGGVRVAYVEGNRDFAIGRGATAGLFDVIARRELVESFGETRYHFSHGDLINDADRPYRVWRAFAKGLLAPVGLRLLPAGLAMALAERLEARLRTTNQRNKTYFPVEQCRRFARRQVAAGADVVVVGHFHRFVEESVDAESRSGRFISLPFWHQEPRPLVFDKAGMLEG